MHGGKSNMKKLGLIGGTGPESTIEYYRQIEYGVQAKAGSFPNLTIESLSVFDVLRFCEEKDYKGLTAYLIKGFQCLADAGADFACLTGITPHLGSDQICESTLHPASQKRCVAVHLSSKPLQTNVHSRIKKMTLFGDKNRQAVKCRHHSNLQRS